LFGYKADAVTVLRRPLRVGDRVTYAKGSMGERSFAVASVICHPAKGNVEAHVSAHAADGADILRTHAVNNCGVTHANGLPIDVPQTIAEQKPEAPKAAEKKARGVKAGDRVRYLGVANDPTGKAESVGGLRAATSARIEFTLGGRNAVFLEENMHVWQHEDGSPVDFAATLAEARRVEAKPNDAAPGIRCEIEFAPIAKPAFDPERVAFSLWATEPEVLADVKRAIEYLSGAPMFVTRKESRGMTLAPRIVEDAVCRTIRPDDQERLASALTRGWSRISAEKKAPYLARAAEMIGRMQ
jgi:hypothetical protein